MERLYKSFGPCNWTKPHTLHTHTKIGSMYIPLILLSLPLSLVVYIDFTVNSVLIIEDEGPIFFTIAVTGQLDASVSLEVEINTENGTAVGESYAAESGL